MPRRDWGRKELIVAFNLYCKIPFGRIHIRNPLVIQLANAIGRTPSAVSWKLANFARLDPALKKRHVAGATHGAQAEIEIWNEFDENWEELTFESERLLREFEGNPAIIDDDPEDFPEGRTRDAAVRARVNQGFFRAAVLAAYGSRCCITGLSISELLNASHIVPWSVDVQNRTNPRNGLCLSALHDRAFDCGLITVTTNLKVRVSPKARDVLADKASDEYLWRFEGVAITAPHHFAPSVDFLRYHNENVFIRE